MEKKSKKGFDIDVNEEGGKQKAKAAALGMIEKKYGKGSIMRLGDNAKMNVSVIPTGSLTLDLALGVGGVPRGRIVEIYGPESSGKTTLALHIAAEVQKMGGDAAFIDAEHALDPVYAKAIGVNIDELLISQPDDGEQALEITEALIRSNAIDVIIVDSVAALVPKTEIEGDMGQATVGAHARLMSQALRKLSGAIAKSQCVLIFINQLRDKIGTIYGNPETTTGGRALRFYASVRIDVRRGQQIKDKADIIGNHIKCKVAKNKVAPPFKVAEFDILYGEGISKQSELIELGVTLDIIEKSGSWFSYEGSRIGQGKDNVRQFLKDNEEIAAKIEAAIRAQSEKISGALAYTASEDDEDDGDDGLFDEE